MATFGWICLVAIIIFGAFKAYKILMNWGVVKNNSTGGGTMEPNTDIKTKDTPDEMVDH